MKKQDFIDALYEAGWDSTADAQHSEIEKLWASIFPCVAALEVEVQDLQEDVERLLKQGGC